ncbi:MAG: HAD family phosphatase [Gemmatimonadetes bacterium]|nr:HAD family phosphatase [Gemmatimonadota bacterium]
MDGLLVDSERLERRIWRAASRAMGVELTDEQFATFIGHPAEHGDGLLRQYFGAGFDVAGFRAACRGRMEQIVATEGVPLRAGALAWLAFLAARGIPYALATSSPRAIVEERLGPHLPGFAAVVTRADVARGKPFPDIYQEAARRLGVAPGRCLAVEDSPARRGGRALRLSMPLVVVPDLVPVPTTVAARAVAVFATLDELREAATRSWPATRAVQA